MCNKCGQNSGCGCGNSGCGGCCGNSGCGCGNIPSSANDGIALANYADSYGDYGRGGCGSGCGCGCNCSLACRLTRGLRRFLFGGCGCGR